MHAESILVLAAAYLLGSVPYGFLAGKICGKDIRREGSGNIGATNALRVLGKGWGYAVFALDFTKGFLPVFLLGKMGYPDALRVGAAILTIVGHNFPVWLGFRGGKGIATSAGVILALFPYPVFLASVLAWVIFFFATRYVSVASIAASLALAAAAGAMVATGHCSPFLFGVAAAMTSLALYRHRGNIARLRQGTEPKFTKKAREEKP